MDKNSNKNQIDMLNGPLVSKLIRFAVPIFLSLVLQALFNSADIIVIGHFVGDKPLAALGATTSLIHLLINLFLGLSVGVNVACARYVAMENVNNLKKQIHTSILFGLLSGTLILIIGILVTEPALKAMGTPTDILDYAVTYMKIYFLGMPALLIYNNGAAILRSFGDTKRPLIALSTGGIINVILNLFFVIKLGMKIEGVAIATVASEIISAILVIYYLVKEKGPFHLDLKNLMLDKNSIIEIISIGVPAGLQNCMYSIANVIIQSFLNEFGSIVIAGSAASNNLESYIGFITSAFISAVSTFISQNFAVGNYKRCRKIYKYCMLINSTLIFVVSWIVILFAKPLLSIFSNNEEIIRVGNTKLFFIAGFEFIDAILEVTVGTLRGYRKSLEPTLIMMVGICAFRLMYMWCIFPHLNTIEALFIVYPLSWVVAFIPEYILYRSVIKKYPNEDGAGIID